MSLIKVQFLENYSTFYYRNVISIHNVSSAQNLSTSRWRDIIVQQISNEMCIEICTARIRLYWQIDTHSSVEVQQAWIPLDYGRHGWLWFFDPVTTGVPGSVHQIQQFFRICTSWPSLSDDTFIVLDSLTTLLTGLYKMKHQQSPNLLKCALRM